jgi:hypothetical protein
VQQIVHTISSFLGGETWAVQTEELAITAAERVVRTLRSEPPKTNQGTAQTMVGSRRLLFYEL